MPGGTSASGWEVAMGSDVKDVLRRAVEWYEPTTSDPETAVRRTKRREHRRKVGAGVIALFLFAGSAVILYGAFAGSQRAFDRPVPADNAPTGPRTSVLLPGVTISYPGEWTLLDLWPSGGVSAVCDDSGTADGGCERVAPSAGEPILQLANHDLGLSADVCSKGRPLLPKDAAVLYVAYDRRAVQASGLATSSWPVELGPGDDSPCSVREGGDNLAASWLGPDGTPYLAFGYLGPEAPATDRDALLAAFASMSFETARTEPSGFTHPAYVIASGVDRERPWNLEATIAGEGPAQGPEIILDLHRPDVGGSIFDLQVDATGMAWAGAQDGTMVWGAVSPEVARVEAVGQMGETTVGEIAELPASLQVGYFAFVISIPDPTDTTITAYDADGAEITSASFGVGEATGVASLEESVTTFKPSEGWNLVLTTIDPNGSQDLPIVWAANVPFSPEESTSGFPSNTVRDLPADGIVITVIGPRKYTGETVFPPATFPLTISQGFCSHDQYETQPAPHVSKCLVDTMVGDELLNVTVWFGRNTPSYDMYEEANAQLARLVVPEQS
jgi:hypothetical protein